MWVCHITGTPGRSTANVYNRHCAVVESHFTGLLLLATASRQVHVRHNAHVHANVTVQLSSKSTPRHTVASCPEQVRTPQGARCSNYRQERHSPRPSSKAKTGVRAEVQPQRDRPATRTKSCNNWCELHQDILFLFSTQSEPPDCRGHDLHNLRKTARSPSTVTARLNLGTRWSRWRGASEAQGFANLRFHRFGHAVKSP